MEDVYYNNKQFFNLVEYELAETGLVRINVKGWSMEPIIRNQRDDVLLESLEHREPQIGDICLFVFRGRHIVHRFVRMKDGYMIMRGDNNLSCEYCRRKDVVAVVRTIYRDGKEVSPNSRWWHAVTMVHRSYKWIRHQCKNAIKKLHII